MLVAEVPSASVGDLHMMRRKVEVAANKLEPHKRTDHGCSALCRCTRAGHTMDAQAGLRRPVYVW